jgi:hypothetical protein
VSYEEEDTCVSYVEGDTYIPSSWPPGPMRERGLC